MAADVGASGTNNQGTSGADNPKPKPQVVFMGTPFFAVPALRSLLTWPAVSVVGVWTQAPKPRGRGHQVQKSAVHQAAEDFIKDSPESSFPIYTPRKLDTETKDAMHALAPDVAVVAAYGKILPTWFLDIPKHGCVNLHASLLPRWRGASPIHQAILAGDLETGITLMKIDAGMDTGDMLAAERIPIKSDATTFSLTSELADLGAPMLRDHLLDYLAGKRPSRPQPAEGVTHAPLMASTAAELHFSEPADTLERRIRAFHPKAFFHVDMGGKPLRIRVLNARAITNKNAVMETENGKNWVIECGKNTRLAIETLQPEGKKPMPADAFLRGLPEQLPPVLVNGKP